MKLCRRFTRRIVLYNAMSTRHLFNSMEVNVDIDKRKGDKPIPGNLEDMLTESQKLALPGIKFSGWELRYVRRPLFHEPVLVMPNSIENRLGILDAFGIIKQSENIKVRKQGELAHTHSPANALVWV